MRFLSAVCAAALLAACGSAPESKPVASVGNPEVREVGTFEGVFDSTTGAIKFRGEGGDYVPNAVIPQGEGVGKVVLSTSNLNTAGTACSGPSVEADITVTNNTGAALDNVYVEIQSMSLTGREACNSSGIPRPGSTAVGSTNGLWSYGSIAGSGGTASKHWSFAKPASTSYTFKGRVIAAGALSSHGAGSAWGTTINDVIVDSDGAALYVSVKFSTPPNGNNLYVLVDDTNRTSGMSGANALTYDPTGSWGALSTGGNPLNNSAGADFDYFQAGSFTSDGTLTQSFHKTITGAAASSDAAGVAMTQDIANGRYNFKIPYTAIAAGAVATDAIKVYALFGKSNEFDLGIHSAAPAPTQAQVDLMNNASGHGLGDLDTAAASHTLASSCSPTLVISTVYGGGGGTSTSASYNQDFIELHNRSSQPFAIPAGWSLQYGSSTGAFGSSTSNIHALPQITIAPGGFAWFKEGTVGTGSPNLPSNADGTTGGINLSGSVGKVVLAKTTTGLGACPLTDPTQVVDMMGYGGTTNIATCGGTAAAGPTVSQALSRATNGCSTAATFSVATTPVPRGTSSAAVAAVSCEAVCQ